jgi:eukaryotic-like serine/threonine-protein kinase
MRTRFVSFPSLVILLIVILTACGPNTTPIPTALPPTETPVPPTATVAPPTETSTPTIVPTPTLGIGSTMVGKDRMMLVYVSEGEFLMGSADSDTLAQNFEKPQHTVFLNAFWIDQTEVTNQQYRSCIDAGGCNPHPYTGPEANGGWDNYMNDAEFDNHPVIYVTWEDAKAYCEWVGRRLPTEAEWEKAARGTDGQIFPWGNDEPNENLLIYNRFHGAPVAVKSYPNGASPYGAYDMAGNVWEWVNDLFGADYYSNSPTENPLGPDSGNRHVVRGGAYRSGIQYIRTAYRLRPSSDGYTNDGGFRCALSAE